MGGADTEIADGTTTVALEIAWFEPFGIAASVTRTGLRSDASNRFERGRRPVLDRLAIARFAELLAETCPDLVVHAGAVDARAESLPTGGAVVPGPGEPGEPHPRHRARSATTWRGCSTRSASPCPATIRSRSPWRCRRWRPDCGRGDRRHRGGRRATTATATSPSGCPRSPLHGHLTPVQQRRRQLRARCSSAWGSPR